MYIFSLQTFLPLLLTLATQSFLAAAQGTVAPYPAHSCANENFYSGDTACANDLTMCCAGGADCCAGGCCPITASCINRGTANEGCCPAGDPSACGSAPTATAGSGTSPPASGPSVSCVGVDSDWYCPHGYTCIYSDEGCAPPPGSGNAPISSTDLFTSNDFTSVTSTPMFVETSTAAIESPTTSFGTTNSAASPTGGSGTTTSSSAAAASPTKADGKSGPLPNTVWALGSLLMAAIAYTAFL